MHFVTETWDEMNSDKEARLMILFSITQEELDVVGRDRMKDLILERIALLACQPVGAHLLLVEHAIFLRIRLCL